ncbi:MAG: hypothetical protein JSU07_06820 [Bacteroidetes bacterium]|nr:hypothetical protein [Bacteroidota bacterium]
MIIQKIKWMAFGVITTSLVVLTYNNFSSISSFFKSQNKFSIEKKLNPEFAQYVSGFTSGIISSGSSIKLKLANEINSSIELNKQINEELISFSPKIEGGLVWKDAQTLEFTPATRLQSGQKYTATFHLNKLIEVKKELADLEFGFEVVKQSLVLNCGELKSYNSNDFEYYSLSGELSTADFIEPDKIEKTMFADLNNSSVKIKWIHNDKNTMHKFILDSIKRPQTTEASLTIKCLVENLNLPNPEVKKYKIAPIGKFQLLNVALTNETEQGVQIVFSNPLDATQSLEGLITLGSANNVRYIITNNIAYIYPNQNLTGSQTLYLNNGIKDAKANKTVEASQHAITFNELKPAIKFLGDGTILPSTNGLTLPFETVNLRAVDVKIIKIYENNVLQFLQNNDINGSSQLAQVGKKIVDKRLNLGITNSAELATWKKSAIDISSLIKPEPGAIYRVILTMRKSYSAYSCIGNNQSLLEIQDISNLKQNEEDEPAYFGYYYGDYDTYNNYDYQDYDGSDWQDRDDPCKDYYYRQYERTASKNILASDIGLTLKKGNDGSYLTVVNNLITTEPVSGAEIELYDFQKQLIEKGKTSSNGQLLFTSKNKASFLIAKKNEHRAYLRLDDGASNTLTMFDVNGDYVKKGIKGFIYGERGVWRPGDTLFLNFILEDKKEALPPNHPVVFELTNPQGQLIKRMLSTKGVNGFYNFTCVTDKNAPTGLWNAVVKVGSSVFYKTIRVETIMPNRLKIEVNAGDNKFLVPNKTQNLTLHSNWLTGAIAKNLSANVSVALNSINTTFEKYPDYSFNSLRNFNAQNIVVFDGKLDDKGAASAAINFNIKNAPGFLNASFTTKVFEPGGAFSIDKFNITYSPFNCYVGIKMPEGEKNTGILYTGKNHRFDILTLDPYGKTVSNRNVKVELYKLEWHWWWDQYNDDAANYANDVYHKSVFSQEVTTVSGKAQVNINIKENDWGRYLIRVSDAESGHTTSQIIYFDWINWMSREGSADNKIMANMLHFTSDKNEYKVDEEATINIPTPEGGRALVTIENGSRVIDAQWIETKKGNTNYKVKITPDMAPNVYVYVSLMQPHKRSNDLPIRLYGVLPLNVNNPQTHLNPTIDMPQVLVPEKPVNIKVSEKDGKEMAFTLAVVDEGLLDITRYKTPNPHSVFYAKEALGVKTWDSYDNVIGAYSAELERILSIGGGDGELSDDGSKANRFKPMVKFFGPYYLKKGEAKNISFTMPMYVGSVRTMVISGNKGAYGIAEKTTPVKAPLMVLGTLPRVLSIGEEVKLPVSVFGGDKQVGNTLVKVELNDKIQIVGTSQKSININKNDEKLLTFDLKTKNITGIAKVKVTASAAGYTSTYQIELDVRNPNPYQTSIKDFYVEAGKAIKENYAAEGLVGTVKGVLELSTIPPINLEERLNYLLYYPHGCVEQITSQAFAQLYLSEVVDLTSIQKNEIDNNIKAAIKELANFQTPSGGLSYWQGTSDISDWGTSYAGHFLTLAEKKGYLLPQNFKLAWLNYMKINANGFDLNKNSKYKNDVQQAYRLYVLALSGNPLTSAMNRLREYKLLSVNSFYFLAGAYAHSGQFAEADKLLTSTVKPNNYFGIDYATFGSTERDEAVKLEILTLLDKKRDAFLQVKKVSEALSSKMWMSTQSTAYSLYAVSSFIKKFGAASAMQASVSINGIPKNLPGKLAITQLPIDFKNNFKGNFEIKNNGKGVLFARLITRGKPAIGEEQEAHSNIEIDVIYKNLEGKVISVNELEQGTEIMMSVTIKNTGSQTDLRNLALSTYIPSGWEINNAKSNEEDFVKQNNNYTYQDVRDDRVLTYFDLSGSKTINISLTTAYEGKFYLPAVNIEAMYDNNVFARTKGQWIRVLKNKQEAVTVK